VPGCSLDPIHVMGSRQRRKDSMGDGYRDLRIVPHDHAALGTDECLAGRSAAGARRGVLRAAAMVALKRAWPWSAILSWRRPAADRWAAPRRYPWSDQ